MEEDETTTSGADKKENNDLIFIEYNFDEILKHISKIELYLKQFAEQKLSHDDKVFAINEALIYISWRVNEIDKKYKYGDSAQVGAHSSIFAERNWFLLDCLADVLNTCGKILDNKKIQILEDLFASIGISLDQNGVLDENGEIGNLKKYLSRIKDILLGNKTEETNSLDLLSLDNLDSFVSIFSDDFLLSKICKSIDEIFEIVDIDNVNQVGSFINKKDDIRLILRCLEVIGESVQKLSYDLRIKDNFMPWNNNARDRTYKKSSLHDLRTKIQHSRDKIEVLAVHEPALFQTLLTKCLPFIKNRVEKLKYNVDEKYILQIRGRAESNDCTTAIAADPVDQIVQISKEVKQNLDAIVSAVTRLNKLDPIIVRLISYLNADDNALYKILISRAPIRDTEEVFLALTKNYMDDNELKDVYRILTGKKLTYSEIAEFICSISSFALDLDETKRVIRNIFTGIEPRESLNAYLEYLPLSKEDKKILDNLAKIFNADQDALRQKIDGLLNGCKDIFKNSNEPPEKISYFEDIMSNYQPDTDYEKVAELVTYLQGKIKDEGLKRDFKFCTEVVLHKIDRTRNESKIKNILVKIDGNENAKESFRKDLEKESDLVRMDEQQFKDRVKKAGYKYSAEFQDLFKKLKGARSIPSHSNFEFENFVALTGDVASAFETLHNSAPLDVAKKMQFKRLLEYYIEAIGLIADDIKVIKYFHESMNIAISYRYLELLAVCRKSMAHYPLEIDEQLLEYISDKLILHTRPEFERQEDFLNNQARIIDLKELLIERHRDISIEDLIKHKIEIFMVIEGLGFKSNFKLFHKTFQCSIGAQGDMCFLVEPIKESVVNIYQLYELELRLSVLLDANIHVYTQENSINVRLKISSKQMNHIERVAKDLELLIAEHHFAQIYDDDRWSSVFIPGCGQVNVSEYIERKDFEDIFFFVFDKRLDQEEIEGVLHNPQQFQNALEDKLAAYNLHRSGRDNLIQALELINCRLISPVVLNYKSIKIPVGTSLQNRKNIMPIIISDEPQFIPSTYPAYILKKESEECDINQYAILTESFWLKYDTEPKQPQNIKFLPPVQPYHKRIECVDGHEYPITAEISSPRTNKLNVISLEQFWNYNNWLYQRLHGSSDSRARLYWFFIVYNSIEGNAYLVEKETTDDVVIDYNGYLVELSAREMDLLYIDQDQINKFFGVPGYKRVDVALRQAIDWLRYGTDIPAIKFLAAYIAKILRYSEPRLMGTFDCRRQLNTDLFSQATSVEHRFKKQDLKDDRLKTKKFRQDRLEQHAYLSRIIREKSDAYVDDIYKLINNERQKNPQAILALLALLKTDKEINQQLDDYYLDNESDILALYQMQDAKQKYVSGVISDLGSTPNISTKEEFLMVVRSNPCIVKTESIRGNIITLLSRRVKEFLNFAHVFAIRAMSFNAHALTADKAFVKEMVLQFKPFVENFEQHVNGRNGELLIPAYNYYKKFDMLLEQILSPTSLAMLNNDAGQLSYAGKHSIYKDFCLRYIDDTQAKCAQVELEDRVLMLDGFPSEIELCNIQRKQKEFLNLKKRKYFDLLIENMGLMTESINLYIESRANISFKVPEYVNGILAYSSELDNTLSIIHGQIASHRIERGSIKADLQIDENFVAKLWNSKFIKKRYAGEVRGSSIFKLKIKTLDELLEVHDWSEKERNEYKLKYPTDEKAIAEYYEFKEKYDLLKTLASRAFEYEEYIKVCNLDLAQHLKMNRSFEVESLKAKLKLYINAYEHNKDQQKELVAQTISTSFAKQRIIAVSRDPDYLELLLSYLDVSIAAEPDNQDSLIKSIAVRAIHLVVKKVQEELMDSVNIKQLEYSPQIIEIKAKLQIHDSKILLFSTGKTNACKENREDLRKQLCAEIQAKSKKPAPLG